MRIFPISFSLNCKRQDNSGLCAGGCCVPDKTQTDVFVKNGDIAFFSNTSAGNPLRKLKKIKCPYFGTEMLSWNELVLAEKHLDTFSGVKEAVSILKKYRKYMLKTEKKIFKRFEEYSKINPEAKLHDCLKLWYDEAITKLKLDEFNVLDDVDKISLKLSPENAFAVHARTTRCRQVILENKKEDTFKRRILLDSLDEIHPKRGEKRIFEGLKDRAVYLPTSGTSENAFVVKYADRSEQEIAKRLIRPSLGTIEHVKPNSRDGENTIGNFMLVSAGANSLRSNMQLYKFVNMFPNIPKYCQKYINQIIELIHKGWLKGNETYPYKIRKTLAIESKGSILLDLSGYKYSEKEATEAVKNSFNHQRKVKFSK